MGTQQGIERIKKSLQAIKPDTEAYPDDYFAWLTCQLACEAIEQGNFGVGCVLVDVSGNVILKGHNEVFSPYFRSNRHAEMVVMDAFEDQYQDITDMCGYTLYTSLEPCPMCLIRLITSGVETVKYVAPDPPGGMVHLVNNLPSIHRELASRQAFSQAQASPDVVKLAQDIFLYNAAELKEKVDQRCPTSKEGNGIERQSSGTAPATSAPPEKKLEFMGDVLEAAEKRRDSAENKASILLASNAILLTGITSFGVPTFLTSAAWTWPDVVNVVLATISLTSAGFSSLWAIRILAPFMKKKREQFLRITSPEFNVFFCGKIIEFEDAKSYLATVASLTQEQLLEQLTNQAYNLSRIIVDRYKWLQRSHRAFLLAILTFVALVLADLLM